MSSPLNMPLFANLKARMDMLGQRQKVLAENISNVSTPGYVPRDVDRKAFDKAMANADFAGAQSGKVAIATTHNSHLTLPAGGAVGAPIMKSPDSETTLDGNKVVVEEQMMKIAETRMEFETAIGLYTKSLDLMRLAIKPPGN